MKSFTKLLITLLAVLGCTLTTMAANLVSTQTINGLRYYLYDDYTATVTTPASGNFYNGPITIPSSVTYSGNSYSVTTVGDGAFKNCIGVNSVTISSGVTKIEQSAFNGCTEMLSISIPNTVSSIGTAAFANCSSLTSVTIPNRVSTLPTYSFTKCTSLKSVTIPSSVTTIGYSSFDGCTSLENVTIPSYVTTIELYAFRDCSSLTEITIPNSVTSMVGYSFCGCSSLTSVVIGNGVSTIEGYTFAGCTNLEEVTIGSSVTTIEEGAFNVCENLKKITINSDALASAAYSRSKNLGTMFGEQVTEYVFGGNVTAIGEMAFYSCTDLATVTIPSSVTSVGYQAFLMCSGITTVNINSNANIEEAYLFFTKDGKRYWVRDKNTVAITGISTSYSGNVVIPKTVTAGNTFNVTAIDNTAFYNCTELTSVSIPNSITKIGGNAFHNCTGLTSITIPNSVTSIGNEAFSGCSGLTSITIPSSITSIESKAFSDCSGLTSITIPENVTTLGDKAFTGCSNLTTVTINSNAVVSKTYTSSSNLTSSFGSATEYVLGEGVTAIGDYAFYGNINLTSITIPEGVTSIGAVAFSGCSGMTSVTIPESVTSIGNSAFYNCSGLTTVTIPENVTSIGNSAFYNCSGLTSVTIAENVTSIGDYAFYNCSNAKEFVFEGETPPTFGTSVFNGSYPIYVPTISAVTAYKEAENMTSYASRIQVMPFEADGIRYQLQENGTLTVAAGNYSGDIVIPSSVDYNGVATAVTAINASAFSNCTGLTSVTIPECITSIGTNAFSGCNGLTSITINSNASLSSAAMYFIVDGIKYQVLDKNSVSVASNSYSGNVEMPEDVTYGNTFNVTSIGSSAFARCNVTSVTIPESITSIGQYAFYNCTGLTSITIPKNILSIGSYAFSGCSNLTKVTINNNAIAAGSYTSSSNISRTFGTQVTEYVFGENVTSIGDYAFCDLTNVTSVTLSENLTTIGERTFYGCTGLTSVTIPENVTTIGEYAFYKCTGLTSVTIPESVTTIGDYGFRTCSNVQEFVFEGETPPTFGYSVFYESSCPIYVPNASAVTAYNDAENMSYYASRIKIMPTTIIVDGVKYDLQNDGTFAVIANDYSGEIVIRESVDYKGVATAVTSIAADAFKNCTNLTAVTIPNSVTSIGSYAFSGCTNLTKITINSNVIASKTYTNGSNLKNIFGTQATEYVFGDDVTAIGNYSFYECTGLTSVTIPESVESIGSSAFYGCTGLTSIIINSNASLSSAAMYFIKDGFKYQVLDKNSLSVVSNSYSGDVVIPENVTYGNTFNVTAIKSYTFYNLSELTSVTIPETVTSIGETAFYGSSNVQEFVFKGITPPTFGTSVFYGSTCPIYVPNASAVTAYKAASNMTYYASRVQVRSVTIIVDGIKYDMQKNGTFAVVANDYSGEVVIRESIDCNGEAIAVSSIAADAFKDCTDLTAVTIPNSMTSIDATSFSNCTSLTKVTINSNAIASNTTSSSSLKDIFGTQVKEYILGEGVTEIGTYAFYKCSNLTSVIIPEGVTSIGYDAFYNCSNLKSVIIPEGVTEIGNYAFYNCSNLTSVTIPESVTSIGKYAFYNCSGLTNIPGSVTEIGEAAFYNCSGLTSVTIPEGVTVIEQYVFSGCTGLTSVIIPESVTSIYKQAFAVCSGLTSLTIPESVTYIGQQAFYYCSNLQEFIFEGETPPSFWYDVFEGTTCPIYVPNASAVTAYKNATNMSSYKDRVQEVPFEVDGVRYQIQEDGTLAVVAGNYSDDVVIRESVDYKGVATAVTAIKPSAFSGCTGLTSVTIPESVTSIGSNAFSGCTGLTSVTIPENVTSIGSSAFSGCTGLTSVTIPENVTSIASGAFFGCTGLTSVTISENVTEIGSKAFYGCTGLTSVIIPESVTSISYYAFSDCTNLTKVTINGNAISKTYTSSSTIKDIFGDQVTEYVFGEGVTSIGSHAFYNCKNVQEFVFEGETPPTFGSYVFYGSSCPIYVPNVSAITAYKNASNMSSYGNRVQMKPIEVDGVKYQMQENGTFAVIANNYSGDVVILSSIDYDGVATAVTSIVNYAFYGCTGLTSVIIPESVTSIGYQAFYNCSNAQAFVFEGETPPTFGGSMFNGSSCPIYVPNESAVTAYNNATNMSGYKNRVQVLPIYTISVVANNDEYGTVSGGGTYGAFATTTISATAVEPYRFVYWDVDENTEANRTITVTSDKTYTAIFKRTLTVSDVMVADKVYDGNATAQINYTSEGVLDGDDVIVTALFDDKNVGLEKTVTLVLEGENASDYVIVAETTDLKANITAKTITISELAAENKEYDGTTTATVTYVSNGVIENDDVTIEPNATFADKNVGEDKVVTYSFEKSGDDADNYELSVETVDLKANITAKSIAISNIVAENKEYDGSTAATVTYTANGIVENDDMTIEHTAAFADKNIGEDIAVIYSFEKSGVDADNYELSVETVDLKANITAKSIAISNIVAEDKEYDGTTTATGSFTYDESAVLDGESVTIAYEAAFENKNVGEDKTVMFTFSLSGDDAAHYTLAETTEVTANISAKTITISELATENKEYDGTTAATITYTATSMVENDDVTIEPTATFADKNVGEDIAVTYSFAKLGEDADNYILSVETVDLKANITAKAIAISEIVVNDKVYDGTSIATATFTTTGIFEDGDVTVDYTASFEDENVGENKNVSLTFELYGEDIANYILATATASATAAITANNSVEVTITENSGTETYDGTEKTVTGYTVDINTELYTESDFTFSGTAEVSGTDAGTYEMNIVADDFANINDNFANVKFTVVDGKLTIEKSAETPNMPEVTAETRLLNITDVALPEGWAWADETIVLVEGENSAVANYVGDDAGNYTVESVTITITRLPCLHDGEYTIVDAKEVTCTVDGYTGDHKCSICGAIFEQGSVIPAKGHKAGEPVEENRKEPTCLVDGSVDTVVYCTIDNEEISRETHVLPATGHIAGEPVIENYIAPTCTEAGTVDTLYYCTIDGELISKETYVLPADGHKPSEKVAINYVPATITTEGSVDSVITCTVCGEVLYSEHFVLPVLDHEHIAGEPVEENRVEPTCLVDGSVDTVVYCTVNGEELSREHFVLPALGHKPSEKVAKNYVAPTCLVDGSVDSVVTCTVCGEVLSEEHFVLPATGHIAGEPVIENYVAPTCTEAGTVDTVYYCTINNELISRETYVLEAKGHLPSEKVAKNYVAPTCLVAGSVDSVITCTICGEVLSEEHFELPATGHIAGEPEIENYIAPTCTEAGTVDTLYYCTIDGELISKETYELPAVGHKPSEKVAVNYVPATTTTEGSVDSVITCTVCGEVLYSEHFVLPVLDHEHIAGEPVEENRVEPTCLVDGSTDTVVYCTVNGEVLSREHYVLPALGHTAGEPVIENYTAPTCTEAGTVDTVYYCTIDNELISRETYVLEAKGHLPSEKVAKNYVAPTCLVAGSVDSVITCTICGEVLSEEHFDLPATGHIAGEKVAENYIAPTFTAEGSVDSVVYCTVDGEELSRETFTLPMLQKTIEKIEILSMPKTEYVVGEDIDITGAKISVTFNDGSVEEINLTNEMLSGFDNTLVAEQDITITYLTFTTTIHVTVKDEGTAIFDVAGDETVIYAYGHTIVVETTLTGDIIVNDVNGRIVAKSQANGDRTEIYVPKVGVYAVRIGTVSQKVVIR